MKKIYSFVLAAVAILSAASCQKELVNAPEVENGEKFTVVATAAETKTVLEGNVAYWMPGDKITIFDATGAPVVFTTNITEKAAKAEFTAESFNAPDSLVAVYNPTRAAALTDGKIYPLRAGGDQKPVAGSFDPNAAIAVGGSKAAGSNELVFNNIHALVKFTVGDVVPSSVKLVNNGGGIIVGLLYWNVEAAAIEHSGAGESSVTVSGTYEKGQTYYIAVTPNEAKGGLSVYFDDVLVKNTGENITLLPNTIYNLGTLPAPAEPEPEVPAGPEIPADYVATTLWEGTQDVVWGTAMQALAYNGYNWLLCKPGQYLKISGVPTDASAEYHLQVMYVGASGWEVLNDYPGKTEAVIELTDELLSLLTIANGGLIVQGNNITVTKVELYKDPAAEEGEVTNILINGDFEKGDAGWNGWWSGYTHEVGEGREGGKAMVLTLKACTEIYEAQLVQDIPALEPGTYTYEFYVKADSLPHQIEMCAQNPDPAAGYPGLDVFEKHEAGEDWTLCSGEFVYAGEPANITRIGVQFGKADAEGAKICIDDFKIAPKK